ncbi:MAG: ABC transporter substrate-binding protein [Proteobacteria bacterium]|nr:ABC transporter substrate-binding protein [Burkholderiales bacterium]
MTAPRLTGAVGLFDRTRALLDRRVQVDDFDIAWTSGELESLFARAFETAEFDITELSFCNYLIAIARGASPYVALPIFPTRCFRHHAMFVRTDAGIRTPKDLEGRRVGTREFTNTVSLVVRGIWSDYYGVDLSKVQWVVGDIDRRERETIGVPTLGPGWSIESAGDRLLADLLRDGGLDALCAYSPPRTFDGEGVARMFPHYQAEEQRYWSDTGIFPIMHVMVVRRSLLAQFPSLGPRLVAAFASARDLALAELEIEQAPRVMLPWAPAHLAHTRDVMGRDFWPYGIGPGTGTNQRTLEAQIGWAHAQGLIPRALSLLEFFADGMAELPAC